MAVVAVGGIDHPITPLMICDEIHAALVLRNVQFEADTNREDLDCIFRYFVSSTDTYESSVRNCRGAGFRFTLKSHGVN